jgi:hypothetical protein
MSFDSVYHQNHNFTFDNPLNAPAPILDTSRMAQQVLLSQASTETKARKLFLLERLHTPTKSKPKAAVEAPSANWDHLETIQATNTPRRVTTAAAGKRKTRATSRAPVHAYDPAQTALGVHASSSGFLQLRPAVRVLVDMPLKFRVQLGRDVARQLHALHEAGAAHGGLLERCFLAIDSLKPVVGERARSSRDPREMQTDVLHLGVVVLETFAQQSFESACPSLVLLLARCQDGPDAEEGAEFVCASDLEIRASLKALPGSLVELCSQLCAADATLRPSAEDAWAWLDSIADDLGKLHSPDAFALPSPLPSSLQVVVQVLPAALPDADEGYCSDQSRASTQSFASDDSLLPPHAAVAAATRARSSSRLTEFIKESPAFAQPGDAEADGHGEQRRRRNSDEPVRVSRRVQVRVAAPSTHPSVAKPSARPRSVHELCKLFDAQTRLPPEEALQIVRRAEERLRKDPTLLALCAPAIVSISPPARSALTIACGGRLWATCTASTTTCAT